MSKNHYNKAILLILLILLTSLDALAIRSEKYQAIAYNFVDYYQFSEVVYNGIPQSVSPATILNERLIIAPGFQNGLNVVTPSGSTQTIDSWEAKGLLMEINIKSANGGYLAGNRYIGSNIDVSDVNVDSFLNANFRPAGLFIDFRSNNNQLPYLLSSFYLATAPLGVGPHPVDTNRQVVYYTIEEHQLYQYDYLFDWDSEKNSFRIILDTALGVGGTLYNLLFTFGINNPISVDEASLGAFVVLVADFDNDGDVDQADRSVWQSSFNQTGLTPYSAGDADGDGDVDNFDLEQWQQNLGKDVDNAKMGKVNLLKAL